jgi:DNA-binding XRE family transcriptional regulator
MGRTLGEMIDALPKQRRERIEARYRELKDDVESLRELRKMAGKAQADIAATLKIKQPSVSKIEKQTDMYLSTLRSYVEAIGGKLDLVVRLPSRRAMHLNRLGEVLGGSARRAPQRRATPSISTKAPRKGVVRTDVHNALFAKKGKKRPAADVKDAIRKYIRKRHARG